MSSIDWSIVSEIKEQLNEFIRTLKKADVPLYHQTLLQFAFDCLREKYFLKLTENEYDQIQLYFWGWVDSKFEK